MVCSGSASEDPRCATTIGPAAGTGATPRSGDVGFTPVIGADRPSGGDPLDDPSVQVDRVVDPRGREVADDLRGGVPVPAQAHDGLVGGYLVQVRREGNHRYVVGLRQMPRLP